jgi:hypothetical protein
MSVLPKKIEDFMAKYGIDHDEVWEIKQGRGAFAIKHYALERIAAEQGITFEVPQFAEKDGAQKNVAMMVVGHMGTITGLPKRWPLIPTRWPRSARRIASSSSS